MEQATREYINQIKGRLLVTKVVATCSVKGQRGDNFAGFSSAISSMQEDGTQDLEVIGDGVGLTQAMTLKEAKVAHYLLAWQANVSAHQAAWASNSISRAALEDALRTLQVNYFALMTEAIEGKPSQKQEEK